MKRTIVIALIVALFLVAAVGSVPAAAQSGNTWRMDFHNNSNWQGYPVYTMYSPYVNFNWGTASPGPGVPADNFTARMTTDPFFYAGVYRFTLQADDEILLLIDNVTYLDTRGRGLSGKTQVLDIPMYQGTHHIQVDYREYTGAAYIYVNWEYLKNGSGGTPPPTQPPSTTVPWCQQSASSVQTRYGDYTPCIQQDLQQANCFQSDGAWNSPNKGSIEMEPKITAWGNCEPADQDRSCTVDPNTDPPVVKNFRCSKTLAGWFPTN